MSSNMLSLFFSCLLSGTLYLSSKAIWRIRRNRKPRTLVAKDPILIGSSGFPCGLVCLDGVRVREGDSVLLTTQTDPSKNGVWIVHKNAWGKGDLTNSSGGWVVTSSGDLWLKDVTLDQWVQVGPLERMIKLHNPDFAPNNPAEAAAYLFRLGILPGQILGASRTTCIEDLVVSRFLTPSLGGLLLAKPENLATEIVVLPGVSVRLENPTWSEQVTSHMIAIQGTNELLALDQEGLHRRGGPRVPTPFTSRPLTGFDQVGENLSPIERRSRYQREPLI